MALFRLAAATVALCFSLGTASAFAIGAPALARKLAAESRLLGPASGVRVVDLDTQRVLYTRRENLALAPGSVEKLFTTASALLRFGAEGVLTTTARARPGVAVDDVGSLRGDLYLVGGGDPSLGDAALRDLALQLTQDTGLRRVTGGVVGDDSRFDAVRGVDPFLGGRLGALTWGHGRAGTQGPAQLTADRLQRLLKAAGVDFGRRARAGALRSKEARTGVPVDLAAVDSPPMRELITTTNGPSDNFYAEMLVKALGASFGAAGSTLEGLAVVRADLAAFGIHPRLVDGSGLSSADRTTARQVVRLLERMAAQAPAAKAWMESLAVTGRSGTLRRRGRGTPAAGACRGKTGTLSNVSALSGYCVASNGHTLAFSVLANRVFTPAAKRVEDRMVAAIARYDGP